MALSNKERVGRILEALRDGLGPFVVREYHMHYKSRYLDEIQQTLATQSYAGLSSEARTKPEVLIQELDVQNCLNLMIRNWNDVFQPKLGHIGRSYAGELLTARINWAHQKSAFSNDEAYRIADTAARLLRMISAAKETALVEEMSKELLRQRFEAEAEKSKKMTDTQKFQSAATLSGLKPWREVVQPHPDVASGQYLQAKFMADLAQVRAGTAEREYQDPIEFFQRTYLTEGLLSLLVNGVRRLSKQGGDPVVQLQTAFGGGKSHSMLALYHLCGGKIALSDFPGGERIAEQLTPPSPPQGGIPPSHPPFEGGRGMSSPFEGGRGDVSPFEGGRGIVSPFEGGRGDVSPFEGGRGDVSPFEGGRGDVFGAREVSLPKAKIAVLVGTDLDPSTPRDYPDATVHTLWGELAYQLGGVKGYELVEQADLKGVSPGANTLCELLQWCDSSLIIIDELVVYARNIYGVDGLPCGTFESLMSFLQSLTEAVKRVDGSLLLISLPESRLEISGKRSASDAESEIGGKAGLAVLETLAHIIGRVEAIWKPVTPTESFEIVRRRLFGTTIDYAARDAVINAFGQMYRSAAREFPSGVPEREYLDQMKAAYPIHPELFERLYQDWSTLERFQRTRGVLRLMAAVIHQLWASGDHSLLILPGTLPLAAVPVRNELLRYLPDTWSAVFDTDIDGPESRPFFIDGEIPAIGRYSAARRVARTIFIGSAPSVTGQRIRGLEEIRIRLGCAQPGESAAVFGDALRRMEGHLTYLYTDGSHYWYDTRPTVNKLARDRAQSAAKEVVNADIIARLRKVQKSRDFGACHVAPQDTSDVVDEPQARIVVLPPETAHKRATIDTAAVLNARRFLESRGTAQRLYKNMLVFLAADETDVRSLDLAVREYVAWRSIQQDQEDLNLDAQQRRQVKASLQRSDDTVNLRLCSAYNWLIVPGQPDPMGAIEMQAIRINGDDSFYDRAARKLHNDGLLITQWSPDMLRMELDRYVWSVERGWEVHLKQLWEYLAQYCYFPRLFDHNILLNAIKDGVKRNDAPFAYATGKHAQGYHTGLVFRQSGALYFDETSLLIHPDHLVFLPEVTSTPPQIQYPIDDTTGSQASHCNELSKVLSRYYGRVNIDAKRINKDISLIVEEVIERLTSQLGSEVEVTLEIHARRPDGFDEATIRTISENSRTLKFKQFGFEEA